MREDDKATVVQLHALLVRSGYTMMLKTVLRRRSALGWTFRGSTYCQLIRTSGNQSKTSGGAQPH